MSFEPRLGRILLFITGVLLAWPVSAQPGFPEDVTRFIEGREACDHFRGEAPYDADRRKFLEQQAQKFCAGTDKQLAELKKKYQGDTAVTTKLAEYETDIEPPSRR